MENIVVLGSTGSIGQNTLNVLRKTNRYNLVGISFNSNLDLACKQIEKFGPKYVCCMKDKHVEFLKNRFNHIHVMCGDSGLCEIVSLKDVDFVVNALVGSVGILPSYFTIKNRKRFALANKESLVVAGKFLTELAKKSNVEIVPIDSEHSAIYQCLKAGKIEDVRFIILTASGGPFVDKKDFDNITVQEALNHPNWKMGKKITIDSATMMNKGFEIIEAHWLFGVEHKNIYVVIHKQSIVHSAIEFIDGSVVAQMAHPDMKIPISYALFKPERINLNKQFDLFDKVLTFEKPDFKQFPTIAFAYEALKRRDKNIGLILNAADEVLVDNFLKQRINFTTIFKVLEYSMKVFEDNLPDDIHSIQEESENIKREVKKIIKKNYKNRG